VTATMAITANFKLVFLILVGLFLIIFATRGITAAKIQNPNDSVKAFWSICDYLIGGGFGAFVGLLGAKTL
jgi:hypothetical protein